MTYRFAQKNWISPDVASQLFALFADRWHREKKRIRATRRPDETGPSCGPWAIASLAKDAIKAGKPTRLSAPGTMTKAAEKVTQPACAEHRMGSRNTAAGCCSGGIAGAGAVSLGAGLGSILFQ
jgi:hypothetical protein